MQLKLLPLCNLVLIWIEFVLVLISSRDSMKGKKYCGRYDLVLWTSCEVGSWIFMWEIKNTFFQLVVSVCLNGDTFDELMWLVVH